jgi:hypothetical protein
MNDCKKQNPDLNIEKWGFNGVASLFTPEKLMPVAQSRGATGRA